MWMYVGLTKVTCVLRHAKKTDKARKDFMQNLKEQRCNSRASIS